MALLSYFNTLTFNILQIYLFLYVSELNLKKLLLILIFLTFWALPSMATHNRSGSITYRHLSGLTYEFTIRTCTKSSSEADRDELEISYGDGESDTVPRTNIIFNSLYDVQENYYVGTHTFTGPGTYTISMEDPNRNAGVINITNSVNTVFCIQTQLVISPFLGSANNSLIIEDCPCPEFGCLYETYCYNLSAYDPDGDSLAYSLVPCRGEDCLEMAMPGVYQYPHEVGGGTITLDSITGTLCWINPQVQGEYNLAIKISEYRAGNYIGAVLQDMQLTIVACDNNSPEIEEIADTCVYAGDDVLINFTATDAENDVSIYATGSLFNLEDNPAEFIEDTSYLSVTGTFLWTPTCDQASNNPYYFIVHAEDLNPSVQLSDLMDYRLKVNVPPVQNLSVSPLGGSMQLDWDDLSLNCTLTQYNIYRSTDSSTYVNECCDSDTPELMGYEWIGSSTSSDYIDDSELQIGYKYCYIVTAVLSNGVESCVSEQSCNSLDFEVPVMTNVSVFETSTTTGEDSIYWAWPKELNQTNFPGPYHYQLYRHNGFSATSEDLIHTTGTNASINLVDTFYYDQNLNTQDQAYTYRVELFSDGDLVGSSTKASSIYLSSEANDNQLDLHWTVQVPWTNNIYEVYRETSVGSGTFNLIGTTTDTSYSDTGLVNLKDYCYKVKSIGEYTQSGIRTPLENWSQIHCNQPYDNTAPCAPELEIVGDCDLEINTLNWTNPNNSCADDVTSYRIYFAPFEGDSLTLLAEINSATDTTFIHGDRGSIAGCYYVTAIDSFPYLNESDASNIFCLDNCEGYYELPNVFTPSADGINDLYHPFLPYKFVESIHLQVFNRWGNLVFETTDPDINWDGTYLNSGEPLSDGTYFYICDINEIKLVGIQTRTVQGNITIFNQ